MKKLLVFLVALSAGISLLAADGFSSLEEQMTGREFSAAGLDKLTPAELDALNQWIRRNSPNALAVKSGSRATTEAPKERRGLKSETKDDRTPINARLVGKFSGWDGQAIFKLDNGMIWAQADKDKFYVKEVENPEVVIEPGMFGSWHLRLDGHDDECKVKRIQ